MLFCRKVTYFKWIPDEKQELLGKVTLRVISSKPYDDLWFKIPPNDPKSYDFVPLALQIKGTIEESTNLSFDNKTAYFLIPQPDFDDQQIELKTGDRIRLWLTHRLKCFKFEKLL